MDQLADKLRAGYRRSDPSGLWEQCIAGWLVLEAKVNYKVRTSQKFAFVHRPGLINLHRVVHSHIGNSCS
jgi:hypothetical protein